MRILIVDDENLARQRLRDLIGDIGDHTVVGEALNGSEAIEKTITLKPDLLLMDIRMPVMDGLEAAMHLMGINNPPQVIFTTAYDQHALEAFEVNAVDYLLKPVRKERLASALQKASPVSTSALKQVNKAQEEPSVRTHISVHMRGRISLIPVNDIIYFVADNKYVTVRTTREQHLIEESLVSLEEEFGDNFLRIHRGALVNTKYLKGMEKNQLGHWRVLLEGVDEKLSVSRRHTPAVRRWVRR
ncbi:MAG TPA: DNA-binding response regulator [Gammaproteobacteria bacterium]|nr:DNA-binding response regulator [Gammaproteobacteria bacterium]